MSAVAIKTTSQCLIGNIWRLLHHPWILFFSLFPAVSQAGTPAPYSLYVFPSLWQLLFLLWWAVGEAMRMTVAWSAEGVPWMWFSKFTTVFTVGRFCSSLLSFYFLPAFCVVSLCSVAPLPVAQLKPQPLFQECVPLWYLTLFPVLFWFTASLLATKGSLLQAWYIGLSSHFETHCPPGTWEVV